MKLKTLVLAASIAMLPGLSSATWAPYFGIGGGMQYLQETTSITGTILTGSGGHTKNQADVQRHYPIYFYNKNYSAMGNIFAGLGNKFDNGLYTAVELNATYDPTTSNSTSNNFKYAYTGNTVIVDANHSTTFQMPWRFGLSGILGYYITPSVMPYVRLGVTAAPFNSNYVDIATATANNNPITLPNPAVSTSNHGYLYGGTIGLGSRFYMSNHWFIGLEGDYTRFFNNNQQGPSWVNGNPPYPNSSMPYSYEYQTAAWSLMANLGYQF